jgi:hypothetical protein
MAIVMNKMNVITMYIYINSSALHCGLESDNSCGVTDNPEVSVTVDRGALYSVVCGCTVRYSVVCDCTVLCSVEACVVLCTSVVVVCEGRVVVCDVVVLIAVVGFAVVVNVVETMVTLDVVVAELEVVPEEPSKSPSHFKVRTALVFSIKKK